MDVSGKRVTVMGLGVHGGAVGTVRWLVRHGAQVTVTDQKPREALADSVSALEDVGNVRFVLGEHNEADFIETDMVIRNPAVPRNSKYLQLAREHDVPVVMDSSLFFNHIARDRIIGVTGTKGKTTTAQAITFLLAECGNDVVSVGVDGVSPLGVLDDIPNDARVVFELSSWRLEALDAVHASPHIAVVTSIYQDHLNTYESFGEYIDTKKSIISHQSGGDIAVLNFDDSTIRAWEHDTQASVYWYTLFNLPQGDGVFVNDSGSIVVRAHGEEHEICPIDDIPYPFDHQRRNVLPALLIAFLAGCKAETIRDAVTRLPGIAHRLETVGEIEGVRYVNDSSATMPDATIAALHAFKDAPIVLIAGGSDKNLEFEHLKGAVGAANIRGIVWLPGTATERMQRAIRPGVDADVGQTEAEDMQDAVRKARHIAQPGDTVLLSPGATSFGLFKHEFDRGDRFREAVAHLS